MKPERSAGCGVVLAAWLLCAGFASQRVLADATEFTGISATPDSQSQYDQLSWYDDPSQTWFVSIYSWDPGYQPFDHDDIGGNRTNNLIDNGTAATAAALHYDAGDFLASVYPASTWYDRALSYTYRNYNYRNSTHTDIVWDGRHHRTLP